jgi:hypothetical protein
MLRGSRKISRDGLAVICALALSATTAAAQSTETCCASVIIRGSENGVLPPAPRSYRVWIADDPGMSGWRRDFPLAARDAFEDWMRVGLPVEFTFVSDSTEANVVVVWRRHIRHTLRSRSTWWVTEDDTFLRGEIEIVAAPVFDWRPTDTFIRSLLLHEIGHLLGLEHDAVPYSIMARTISVHGLSRRDIQRARLLYGGFADPAARN